MPTNNHNYSMPARGAEDWDQDWYTNFNALDEDVVLRGPAAERTNYTSYTDTLYIATDTEEVYRGQGDGVGWEQLESFGENPTVGDVTATSVSADSATVTNEMAAGSVTTDEAAVGSSAYTGPNSRPLVSNANANPIVAADGTGDYTSIQEAVNQCPLYLRHKYVIGVQDGNYSGEDVVVPQILTGTAVPNADTSDDEYGQFAINGNGPAPSNVTVNSIAAAGVIGANSPFITGVEIQGVVPWDNERSGILGSASGLDVGAVNFVDSGVASDRGITYYSCNGAKLSGPLDFGTGARSQGVVVKRNGSVNATGATITGSVTNELFHVQNGYLVYNSSTVPAGHTVNADRGIILDANDDTVYGIEKFDRIQTTGANNSGQIRLTPPNSASTPREWWIQNRDSGALEIRNSTDGATKFQIMANGNISFLGNTGNQITSFKGTGAMDLVGNDIRGNGVGSRVSIDDFINLPPRATAPTTPSTGDLAMQDGTNWNPTGSGAVEPVYYDGTAWNAT